MSNPVKVCEQCGEKKHIPENRTLCHGCRRFNSDVTAGRILKPNYQDINTEPFKEPMLKVEDGFGYYGAVTTSKDGEFIQCHICGYFFKVLIRHVMNKHQISSRDYKVSHGLRLKDGLLAPKMREELIERFEKHRSAAGFGTDENNKKAWEASKQKRESGELQTGGSTWTGITRNERALCRAQVLEKIKHVAEVNDGLITNKLMIQEYGEEYRATIKTQFGSWKNALHEADLLTFEELKNKTFKKRKKDMIQRIKSFYLETGHPPYSSDFNSNSDLPAQQWVSKNFGTLNKARRLAGVPEVCYINGNWEEVIDDE